ncbi:hypothetical protein SO802_033729 [Lithocarpus litseifolius]|uniref:Aminotransferase-like plant mobile domain-containing protein n=1 Tax=Lithocarpus litseifolius TaxID=425828 RepID=A0AAW2BDY4_9ROSI
MTITLQDMGVIMGVLVGGLSVVEFTHMQDWGDLCIELLGHRPLNKQVGVGKNAAVMEGPRVKSKWLEEWFSNPLLANATEVLVQQYARFYILGMLGGMLFMDKSGEWLSIMYLQFFNLISNGKNYSWGSAELSWLYRYLCKASEKTAQQIGSVLLLVQLWAWVRLSGSHTEIIWVPCSHIVQQANTYEGFIHLEGVESDLFLSLKALESLNHLERLNLEQTHVRDAALKPLSTFQELRDLSLKYFPYRCLPALPVISSKADKPWCS